MPFTSGGGGGERDIGGIDTVIRLRPIGGHIYEPEMPFAKRRRRETELCMQQEQSDARQRVVGGGGVRGGGGGYLSGR